MRLGLHIRIAKGLLEGLAQAERLGCETVQFFSSNPNAWRTGSLDPEAAAAFKARAGELGIRPIILHTPYLVNLASPNTDFWQKTVGLLVFALSRASLLGADHVVTHIGSHKGTSYEEGVQRICKAAKQALEQSESSAMLLLEAGSGAGDTIGSTFTELADIFACMPGNLPPVGVALDTAHMWAAGYDVSSKKKLDEVVSDFDHHVGLSRLKLIHLNDSRQALGSKADRHWHIGEGRIGLAGFEAVVNHPALASLSGIAETPGHELEQDWRNLGTLKDLRRQ
jgi:deoxyribonuclease IV